MAVICAQCHNMDKDVIKCDKDMIKHQEFGMFRCNVCGKRALVYVCRKYGQLNKNKNKYFKAE